MSDASSPSVFWYSDPVLPGEILLIMGEDFTEKSTVEITSLPRERAARVKDQICFNANINWKQLPIVSQSKQTIHAAIPSELPMGTYACRIRNKDDFSPVFYLNAPDVWWYQADNGDMATSEGWLRLFGKGLSFNGNPPARVAMLSEDSRYEFSPDIQNRFELRINLSALPEGIYDIHVHNGFGNDIGWRNVGQISVLPTQLASRKEFDVTEFGADKFYQKDSTAAFKRAIQAAGNSGGVVYIPRGRYMLTDFLKLSPDVIMKGEGMELVSLCWEDFSDPPENLVDGGISVGIMDLTCYAQGNLRNVINVKDNSAVQRVRIRANEYYMLTSINGKFHGRSIEGEVHRRHQSAAIVAEGTNIKITNCDILTSADGMILFNVDYSLVTHNRIRYGNAGSTLYCPHNLIYEYNDCKGQHLYSMGCVPISLYHGKYSKNIFLAHNSLGSAYGGDREGVTLDGHGTAYLSGVLKADENIIHLKENPVWGKEHKDLLDSPENTVLYILDGRGAGQCRFISSCEENIITLAAPFAVQPDETSTVSIGKYSGHILIVDNHFEDTGSTVQLYPPNYECIVSENIGCRSGNFNVGSLLTRQMFGKNLRVELSWYNQFLNNHVVEGLGWGGGPAAINGKLGGPSMMNIYGVNTENCMSPSRGIVVRGHVAENNSGVRVAGNVCGVVIENCHMMKSDSLNIVEEPFNQMDTTEIAPYSIREGSKVPEYVIKRNNLFNK